ncbi:MAG: biotin--[acetyl-CoA-carboxylase] ligase [Clostridia bacterium]|nr:biotin--[acetyl-CoA-carboxylase] ligase [Clostridia bacterium]
MNHEKLKRLTVPLCTIVSCTAETGSTNTDARALLAQFPDADTILLTADRQTGGRGRQGKSFLSPEGGLYMTLVMKTGAPLESVVNVTSCAAVAAARALAEQGISCGIKWVNDLYLNGAKLAGILVESVNDYETMRSEAVIIGIGVNVARSIFPDEIHAVSLEEAGYSADPEKLCADIVRELLNIRGNGFDFARYADEYRQRSIVLGKDVYFLKNGETISGTAEAINERGGLLVRTGDTLCSLDSGEITLRLTNQQRSR